MKDLFSPSLSWAVGPWLQAGYQELVNAIIRPPRAEYDIEALGPPEFEFVGKMFRRHDFQLRNERGYILECRLVGV